MLHKAWNSKEEMPYCFPRTFIKFEGHTGQNITDFDPNWAFPDYRPVAAFKSLRFALFSIQWHLEILLIHGLTCHRHNIRYISNAHYSNSIPFVTEMAMNCHLFVRSSHYLFLNHISAFIAVSCFLAMWEIWYTISFLVIHIKSRVDKKNIRGHSVPSEM